MVEDYEACSRRVEGSISGSELVCSYEAAVKVSLRRLVNLLHLTICIRVVHPDFDHADNASYVLAITARGSLTSGSKHLN